MENNQYSNNQYDNQYNNQYNNNQYNNPYGNPYTNPYNGTGDPQQDPSSQEPPKDKNKKGHSLLWSAGTLVVAAVVALGCGYGGAYLANQQAGRVVVQSAAPAEEGETAGSGEAAGNGGQSQSTQVSASSGDELSGTQVAALISPTVVSITTEQMRLGQYWFGPQILSGAGSGVIISEDGYILTCAHVVSGADSIMVATSDGTEYEATLTGIYEEGDIAVLKIEATGLQAAVMGDSSAVQLGEPVYAVGNPGGTLGGTITDGIISAVDRTINVSLDETSNSGWGNSSRVISLDVLQTSAAVSPGNSGGGLFNSRGELIGIVNAKSSGESQEGLGFAIPVNRAWEIGESLINTGSYTDPSSNQSDNDAVLEITVTEVNQSARLQGITPGVYVYEVTEGGASDGKLEVNDRIISVDGTMVNTLDDLSSILSEYDPGQTVSVSVERGGQMVTVDIVLAENQGRS